MKLAYGYYPSFQASHQKNPYYSSLVKIYQHGAEVFNKMFSFEVNIRLLPLIQSSNQKNPYYRSLVQCHQHGTEIFNKTCSLKLE